MTAFEAFGRGWGATTRSKAALSILWIFYALVAMIVAAPAASMALEPLAQSRMAAQLLGGFDLAWLSENVDSLSLAAASLTTGAIVAALFVALGSLFLAGGVLTMLSERWDRFNLGAFLGGAGHNFWRFLRLGLLGLIGYALAFLVALVPGMIVHAIYKDGMEYWPMGVSDIVRSVLVVLLLGWMATVLDYAKVRIVADDSRRAVMGLLRSFAFVFRHFGKTMGVWLMNAVLFAVVGLAYLKLCGVMHPTVTGSILLLVALQQLFVLFRTAQRVAVWGAAVEIYQALKPAPVEPAIMEAPVEHEGLPEEAPTESVEMDGSGV